MIGHITVRHENCMDAASDPVLLATDLADWLVEQGVAFREAHHLVGAVVGVSESLNRPLDKLRASDLKKIDKRLTKQALEVFNIKRAMERRQMTGSPGVKEVLKQIKFWKNELKD
jgi:argininosuccinate lyase